MSSKPDNDPNSALHEHVSCELLLTTYCNMGCDYCIARDLPDLIMSIETGKKAIDMFINLSKGAISLDMVFTGGEPFLELKTLKNLIYYAQQRSAETGIDIFFIIKTNGTILDPTIIKFLKTYSIKLVLSIDGTADNHDKYRKDSSGNKTHHIVSHNLKTLIQNNIPCVASMTVHPSLNKSIVENISYLHKLGVKQIDLGPAYGTVLWAEADCNAFAKSMDDVARYIKEVVTAGQNLEIDPLYQESEHVGGVLAGHWGCGAVSTNLAFMPNGQITGCSALAMLIPKYPEMVLGDVWKGLDGDAVDNLRYLAQADLHERVACQRCETANNCSGGCLAINYSTTYSPHTPPQFYCKIISSIPNAWQIVWGKNKVISQTIDYCGQE